MGYLGRGRLGYRDHVELVENRVELFHSGMQTSERADQVAAPRICVRGREGRTEAPWLRSSEIS